MTCQTYETDLALYVDGDLPDRQVPAVERHLASCAACRMLLDGLRSSQAALAELAAEPLDAASLAAVRQRVIAERPAAHRPATPWSTAPWRWALAAGLALAALGGASLWLSTNRLAILTERPDSAPTAVILSTPADPAPAQKTPGAPTQTAQDEPGAGEKRRDSTPRVLAAVSRHVVLPSETALSDDDADQLARAVQVIAAVQRVPDASSETPPTSASEAATFVRLATADPRVVIYCKLEPTGGL